MVLFLFQMDNGWAMFKWQLCSFTALSLRHCNGSLHLYFSYASVPVGFLLVIVVPAIVWSFMSSGKPSRFLYYSNNWKYLFSRVKRIQRPSWQLFSPKSGSHDKLPHFYGSSLRRIKLGPIIRTKSSIRVKTFRRLSPIRKSVDKERPLSLIECGQFYIHQTCTMLVILSSFWVPW